MKTANPYLNFDGNAEEAFALYRSVFGGELAQVIRFRDFGGEAMGMAGEQLDRVAHIALPLGQGGNILMASDVAKPGEFKTGTNSYIHLEADSAEEADRVFEGLAAGGSLEMPLQKTEWAEKFGVCVDRFGVQWMVSYTGDVQFGQHG